MKQVVGRVLGALLLAAFMGSQAIAAGPASLSRVQLSRGGEGWEASAGIDAQGNAVALWVQRTGTDTVKDRIWTKSHPPGQAWSPRSVLSHALPSSPNTPTVRVSAAGEAIAVWTEADGVWTAERPAQGAWGAARLLVAGAAAPLLAMNGLGDAALAWGAGVGPGGPMQLNVMRRDAGGTWQAPQVVAKGSSTLGTHVVFNDLAVADDTGDVLATWETYDAHCSTRCYLVDYVLHASRAERGSDIWADSGPMHGPQTWSHRAFAAVDPAGHAGVAFEDYPRGVMLATQQGAGGGWSTPTLVYQPDYSRTVWVAGLVTDARGNVTLALLDEPGAVAIVGNLVTGLWDQPVVVSGKDTSVGFVRLASSASGAAIMTWLSGDEFFTHYVVRSATRRDTFSMWHRPWTISPAGVELPMPEAAAVNAAGQGIIVFSAFDSALEVHTEYAVTN